MDENNLVQQLLDMIAQKDKIIAELAQAVAKTQVSHPAPPVVYNDIPLYIPEEEQDIRYAYENDLITKQQMEEMLENLNFANSEITIDG